MDHIHAVSGGKVLLQKLQMFQPKIAVFNGKGIFEIFSGKKEFMFGKQPEKIEGTQTVSRLASLFLPSHSGSIFSIYLGV